MLMTLEKVHVVPLQAKEQWLSFAQMNETVVVKVR